MSNRTSLSILNSKISLIFYFLQLLLEFISRKVFIDKLGVEVVGLNTTAYNLLGFLNIAELGIGAAVAVTLYKPLYYNNEKEISEIVALQGYLYRKIALCIALGAIILMAFFPIIFSKSDLPLWYSFASFGVLLYGALLTYFINYKQIVLSANQKNYKILYSYKGVIMIGTIFQIVALHIFINGYLWWLTLQIIFPTFATLSLSHTIRKEYPFLSTNVVNKQDLVKKYPSVIIKIKQVFFHKISGYVLLQSSPIIVYALNSLSVVTVYGNYLIINTGIIRLLGAVFSSINAGVGNLIAQGDKARIYKVFEELFSSRFVIVSSLCFCMYILTDSFINIWLGKEFILNHFILSLLVFNLYLNTMRTVIDSFLQGYGLYKDIWAPVVEAVLNLGLSIAFGYYWGLEGIILGITSSLFLIVGLWKPYFLYKSGFEYSILKYIMLYAKHLIFGIPIWIFSICLYKSFFPKPLDSTLEFIVAGTISFFSFYLTTTLLCAIYIPAQRRFLHRIKNTIYNI